MTRPDHIDGWAGDDKLFWESGFDTIDSRTDAEPVSGGVSNDLIYGVRRHDGLYGDSGNDSVYGGAGTKNLIGGRANSTLFEDIFRDFSVGFVKLLIESPATDNTIVDTVAGVALCYADGLWSDLVAGEVQEIDSALLL